jgi:hypothetical protein
MGNQTPWYAFYPKDFAGDVKVKAMTAHAELVYRRAIDHLWELDNLPNDPDWLFRALGDKLTRDEFDAAWASIQFPGYEALKATRDGKSLYSSRQHENRKKHLKIAQIRSDAGRKGAESRWENDSKDSDVDGKGKDLPMATNGKRMASRTRTRISTSNSSAQNEHDHGDQNPVKFDTRKAKRLFAEWWIHYPKKVDKMKAEGQFVMKAKNGKLPEQSELIKITQAHAKHWAERDPRFIPSPRKWLHNENWADELTVSTSSKPSPAQPREAKDPLWDGYQILKAKGPKALEAFAKKHNLTPDDVERIRNKLLAETGKLKLDKLTGGIG